ncbi:MAG: endonuclease/exonuclease/phosphatase family protein [Devosia sp.]|nr:endonuclease/exonuclease/phosphatase family protein [Devosia sp.]
MVQYSGMRNWPDAGARDRTIDRLLALRAGLGKDVTSNNKQVSFHLATWNIRDFGGHRLNPAPRSDESLIYIAEIISAFDLVAVQEVNEDMTQFHKMVGLLGPHWDYMVTDPSGNMERLAFLFDTRKIQFRHVAGEIVLPPGKDGTPPIQFNRTPFLVAFQAGWFKFNICTVHLLYGDASDTTARRREIADIADFFTKRQSKDGETYVLLGDFNILNPGDSTMTALLGGGFEVRPELRIPTAVASGNYYDQIALRTQDKLVEIAAAGSFRWEDYVFRDADLADYQLLLPTKTAQGKPAATGLDAYRKWRTWQMSDHQLLWAEIKMDFTDSYLASLHSEGTPIANFAPQTGSRADANGVSG